MARPAVDTVHRLAARWPVDGGEHRRTVVVDSRATVGEAIGRVADAFGWDRSDDHHLLTPGLTRYGIPHLAGELGFERRTRDERSHTLDEALPTAGATAQLDYGGRPVGLVVDGVDRADPAGVDDQGESEDPGQLAVAPIDAEAGAQRSRITTDLGPTG